MATKLLSELQEAGYGLFNAPLTQVRDKVLGMESDDIDIAIDNMTGRIFAEHVVRHLAKATNESQKSVAVIRADPDKSKHLECARVHMLDSWIDFVNLRAEEYASNSRVPIIRAATPREDAERRDLTINALFYNINTKRVEDFTGYGLSDLGARLIRTPLDPRQTFTDDPLRMLRTVRFAARYGFVVHDDILTVMRVHGAELTGRLASVVSLERVNKEVMAMLAHPNYRKAIALLVDLGLHTSIFPDSDVWTNYDDRLDAVWAAHNAIARDTLPTWSDAGVLRQLLCVTALMQPLYGKMIPGKRKRAQTAIGNALRRIKLTNKEIKMVEQSLDVAAELKKVVDEDGTKEIIRGGLAVALAGAVCPFGVDLILPALALAHLFSDGAPGLVNLVFEFEMTRSRDIHLPANLSARDLLDISEWDSNDKASWKHVPGLQKSALRFMYQHGYSGPDPAALLDDLATEWATA